MVGDCLGRARRDSGHRNSLAIEKSQRTSRLIFQDSSLLHEPDHVRPYNKGYSWLAGVGTYVGCDLVLVCIGIPFSSQADGTGIVVRAPERG